MQYDVHDPLNRMSFRALTTVVIMLASSLAQAETGGLWHTEVAPPRTVLPAVAIDAGYRGPYLPSDNCPITLHATTADFPFDGYIGFHFRVKDHQTYDTPIIARAILGPHEAWTFSTFVRLRRYGGNHELSALNWHMAPREITIEWRDRSMRLRGQNSAGIPPWTFSSETQLMPLRIVGDAAEPQPASALGRMAYGERASRLPDHAQWYAGFSDVVVPLGVWLDLPRRVRDAILGSAIHVVFYGFPRPNQQFDELDRALIPVTFASRPAAYQVPWPYGNGATITTPFSWMARSDARTAGKGPLPYLVRSAAATWAADAAALSRTLPAATTIPIHRSVASRNLRIARGWPRPQQIVRLYAGSALTVTVVLISVAAWLTVRRRPRAGVAFVVIIMAVFILAARDRIRPREGMYRLDVASPVSPGLVDTMQIRRVYGPSPLPEERSDPERLRTSLTNASGVMSENAEVRTSDTAMAMGMMQRGFDWDAISRWSARRELGETPTIHIRSRDEKRLMIDYESTYPINYVYAQWRCDDHVCFGATSVARGTHGTATIKDATETWPEDEPLVGDTPAVRDQMRRVTVGVLLEQKNRMSRKRFYWFEPVSKQVRSYMIRDFEKVAAGSGSFWFALPDNITATSAVLVSVPKNRASREVTLSWASGSTTLTPTGRDGLPFATASYQVPPEAVREIVANGGIANVAIAFDQRATASRWDMDIVTTEVWEKKP